jgi:hypothetical protein
VDGGAGMDGNEIMGIVIVEWEIGYKRLVNILK